MRWQFIGGMPEDQRRAFLFTNVIDSKGRKYDMPVVVGALASSPAIYALGMGRPVEEIGEAWMAAIAHPIPPVATNDAPCQEVVITGDALKHGRAQGPAGAGVDAGLRCRALSHRDALRHQGPRERRPQHGHLSRRAESGRPRGGAAWSRARRPVPAAFCIG